MKTKTDAAKKKRRESKEKFTTDDASQIQEEAVDQAKTDFFEGAAYKQAKEGQERREFLAASIMERLRCKSLVEVYDLQLLFLNDVVVQQKKHAKVSLAPCILCLGDGQRARPRTGLLRVVADIAAYLPVRSPL